MTVSGMRLQSENNYSNWNNSSVSVQTVFFEEKHIRLKLKVFV